MKYNTPFYHPTLRVAKRIITIFVLMLAMINLGYAQAFITTWKTDNPGPTNDSSIEIPVVGSSTNYDVDWDNDGVFDEFGLTGDVIHDFGSPGIYTIAIQSNNFSIRFDGSYIFNTNDLQYQI